VKFGVDTGHLHLLGYAKFHLNRHRGLDAAPKYQKFPLFGKEWLSGGESLTDLETF